MKVILTLIAGVLLFVSVGRNAVDSRSVSATSVQRYERADSESIAGTWYSFPAGMLLRFDGHGRAAFGVDETGETIGYEASAWFEGQQLVVKFADYAGESAVCETVVGVYEVQLLENGCIRFVTVQDECAFRADILTGRPDLGFDLVYHPVD